MKFVFAKSASGEIRRLIMQTNKETVSEIQKPTSKVIVRR